MTVMAMIRTPAFWHRRPGFFSTLLAPLGWVYASATAARVKRQDQGYRPSCPVICVGNLNAGGTGKTPTTIAMVERILARGKTPIVVSRGFGGSIGKPILVDPKNHKADYVGDEPLLMAAFCQVVVSKDRAAGAKLTESLGADAIIMDDGFQNPSVQKDMSIVVVNAGLGFGNGRCIPAGPLREPVNTGLDRADFCLSIGPDADQDVFDQSWGDQITVAHIRGQILPLQTGMQWSGLRVFAFAGIAHPSKFFETLHALGADVIDTEALADHEPLSPTLLNRLLTRADSARAQLVCTEKDAARIPPSFLPNVLTLPVRLAIQDWAQIDQRLNNLGL